MVEKNILEKNLETMPLSKKLSVKKNKKNQVKIGTSKCISWDNHNYVVILLANWKIGNKGKDLLASNTEKTMSS